MKFKCKEIKIFYVKLKHKEKDRNRQEQTGSERNSRNRQDYMSDIENYYNIKKFISNVRILKAKRSDRISEEQTGIDKIIYLI